MIARRPGRAGDLWFLAAAAAIFLAQQLAISFLATGGPEGAARRVLFFVTTALLVLLALRFRRFWGAWLVAAGILLNLIPMAAHGGAMPVDIEIVESSGAFPEVTRQHLGGQTNHGKDVVLERDDIHFFALSDRYVVDLPGYGTNIYSLGDFVLFAGLALIIVQAPLDVLRSQRQKTPQAA
jgi:hypothetical protein